jgi:predicted esterase
VIVARPWLPLAALLLAGCVRAEPALVAVGEAGQGRPASLPEVEPTLPPAPPAAPPRAAPRTPWPPAPPGVKTAFCLEGVLDALTDDACYFLPERPSRDLLIYLPGLMPPNADSPENRMVETVVANAARRAGIAALVPRGITRAELSAPERDAMGMGHYFSWPTGDTGYSKHARRLVERILARKKELEAFAGAPFERVFLGGSSAGGYFVSHLALRGDFPADGYAVISGGSGRPAPRLADLPKRPLYVGYGDGDIVGPKAEQVAVQARRAGWPVRVSMHHTGHGSREFYLDEAFALFGVGGE